MVKPRAKFLSRFTSCAAAALLGLQATFSSSSANACEIALVLALDASSSVDAVEYELQLKGLASALLSPEVTERIETIGGINLIAFEWSGRYNQTIIAGWETLRSAGDVQAFALTLARHQRTRSDFPTAIGYALGYAAGLFRQMPQPCRRQVIDISGDGVHNEGFGPQIAYRNFPFSGTTVNGLVIKGADPDPEAYYREEVRYGPGAFVVVAKDFSDYERAIKDKLLAEIGIGNVVELKPTSLPRIR